MSWLGDKINITRKQRGWSLDEVSKMTGISKSHVHNIESSKSMPTIDKLIKISRALAVTVDYLLSDNHYPDREMIDKAFLEKFRRLSDIDQVRVEEIIDLWSPRNV